MKLIKITYIDMSTIKWEDYNNTWYYKIKHSYYLFLSIILIAKSNLINEFFSLRILSLFKENIKQKKRETYHISSAIF